MGCDDFLMILLLPYVFFYAIYAFLELQEVLVSDLGVGPQFVAQILELGPEIYFLSLDPYHNKLSLRLKTLELLACPLVLTAQPQRPRKSVPSQGTRS